MQDRTLGWTLIFAVMTVGTFAGVLFAASLAISPSLALLDAGDYTVVKQAQIRILQVSMTIISSIYTVLAAVVLHRERKRRAEPVFRLTMIALLLIVAALIYSGPTDIAYNQAILAWDPAAPPPDWTETRDAWDFANRVRTVPAMVAAGLQTASLLFVRRRA